MPSLKDLKNRIKSVKSTQKITKAMKMVSAAKLRRAKERAESTRPYAEKMAEIVQAVSASETAKASNNLLMNGTGKSHTHLVVVMTSDRGLCGAFNSSITRATRRKVNELKQAGKDVKLYCVGRKSYELLKTDFGKIIIGRYKEVMGNHIGFVTAETIAHDLIHLYETQAIDAVHIVYNQFKSAISQVVTFQQIIPLSVQQEAKVTQSAAPYEFEPEEEEILADLLPRNIKVQLYRALLENAASEQGARMTAMDNATRNAGDMINKLTLKYNRTRQATITKELIEIISGAEAL